jgi:hypothetical protein
MVEVSLLHKSFYLKKTHDTMMQWLKSALTTQRSKVESFLSFLLRMDEEKTLDFKIILKFVLGLVLGFSGKSGVMPMLAD